MRLDTSALAADLGVSRATLHRRAGNRQALMGEALWRLADVTLRRLEAEHDRHGSAPGELRCLAILAGFREAIVGDSGMRRLLDDEPVVAMRVLTDPRGRVQPRVVEAIARLLQHDADAGGFVPIIDVPDLAFALVRLGETFIYADVLADHPVDLDAAARLTEALVRGGR